MNKKLAFLTGLFLICMCALMLQILETRVLSVISYYHLAFFAISMAMFGMTAGSLVVYFNPTVFTSERLFEHLAWIAAGFAVATMVSTLTVISSVMIYPWNGLFMSTVLWLKLIAALIPPYVLAGMGISLALTRSPWPIGQVYGADLAGAAFARRLAATHIVLDGGDDLERKTAHVARALADEGMIERAAIWCEDQHHEQQGEALRDYLLRRREGEWTLLQDAEILARIVDEADAYWREVEHGVHPAAAPSAARPERRSGLLARMRNFFVGGA